MKLNVALCCIAKNENRYLREWVSYYLKLGFNTIYINDNNDHYGERIEDAIDHKYIKNRKVVIIDARGKETYMFDAYNEAYRTYGQYHDYMAFFDCDEFLELTSDKKIQTFLSRKIFRPFDAIYVNWKMYGDNGLVKYEDKPVVERFVNPLPDDFKLHTNICENRIVKTIIKTGLDITFKHPHYPEGKYKPCTSEGKETPISNLTEEHTFKYAFLKHYRTKTVEEYIDKIKRGYADLKPNESALYLSKTTFFKINEYTEEKEAYFNSICPRTSDRCSLYICTHKDYTFIESDLYPVFCGPSDVLTAEKTSGVQVVREEENKPNLLKKQPYYGEMTRIYYAWKNIELKDYVGFCHYNKVIVMSSKNYDLDFYFTMYGAAALPFSLGMSAYRHYALNHSVADINRITSILRVMHPDYMIDWKIQLMMTHMYACNIFVMRREDFYKYCEFVFGVMEVYDELMGFRTQEDVDKYIMENKEQYLKGTWSTRNSSFAYQRRLGGFLCERLTSLYIIHNFKRVMDLSVADPRALIKK